jgi:hypothetical protein
MTRYWFGDSDDWSLSGGTGDQVRRVPAVRKCYDAEVGGTQYTDLLIGGVTPAASVPMSRGLPVRFQGPDEVLSMWCSDNDGPRALVVSTDVPQLMKDGADVVAAAGDALTDLIALTGTQGLALDTDGVPYFDPAIVSAPTLAVVADTDGTPYFTGA